MDSKQILSVGIDIGTSTSQLVFSRLELRNRAAACQIPRFEITDRRIVWQSPVAFTPLTDVDTLDEAALEAFESRLADRFGPLPRAAKELLNVVRLRWEAIRLGMERVKVKNGLMIVHFVGEENSPYYKSDTFMQLLQRVTQRPDRFVLKQHNNRLAMTVRNVKDVEDAYKTLREL